MFPSESKETRKKVSSLYHMLEILEMFVTADTIENNIFSKL